MVDAQLTGILPRSNEHIKATWNFDKDLIGEDEFREKIRKDVKSVVELQKNAGFECLMDGMFLWQDIFRPFTENVEGMSAGALVRWFDNNTFFRKPMIEKLHPEDHDLFLHKYVHLQLLPQEYCKKVVLPGPYTFAALSSKKDDSEIMLVLAEILAKEIKGLEDKGVSIFQFNEFSLVQRELSREVMEDVKQAYKIIRKEVEGKVILHTCFGDAEWAIPYFLDFPVDYVGIDFFSTEFKDIKKIKFGKGLLCGCVDSRNSFLESVDSILFFVENIQKSMRPKDIILSPTCDLEFLPKKVAEEKVKILGEVKRKLGGR